MRHPRFGKITVWWREVGWRATGTLLAAVTLLAFAFVPVSAQTGGIVGEVTGGITGQPLADVQVVVEGTSLGALTNGQGRFLLLNVPVGTHRIRATLIGYGEETADVTVAAGESANAGTLHMFSRAVELEGMVVTGTAIAAQRREIGNSIALITSEDIEAAGIVSIDDILRGKALGLTVQGSSGMAGAGSQILIRGLASINGRNRPLIYLDGIRLNDRGAYETSLESDQAATILNSLNTQDIDRIEIIKGAAASTLYGTEASAGVIQIFTKQGTAGDRRWTLSMETGIAVPTHFGPDEDPTGLHVNDCTTGGPMRPEQVTPDPACPESGSWVKNAWTKQTSISVRGGSESFTYFASGSIGTQEGIANVPDQYDPQRANNLSIRANFTFHPLENLQLRINNSYTRRDINWIPDGDNSEGFLENVTKLDLGETPNNVDSLVFQMDIEQNIDDFTTGVNINYTPSASFQHRLNAGMNLSTSNSRTLRPFNFWDFPQGTRTVDIETTRIITLDYAGSWARAVNPSWNSTLSWGGQFTDREDTGIRTDCVGFIAPGRPLSNDCERTGFRSGGLGLQEDRRGFRNGGFFLQQMIGWKNRLFITGGLRADAFSQIDDQLDLTFDFLYYPKLQATYTLSDHDFWPEWFDTFRLRGAWGESGDPPPQTASKTLWQIAGADANAQGLIIESLANLDVTAERTEEFEIGVDASLFDGRVSFQTTGFRRNTTDGIIFNPLLPSGGIVENVPFNVGSWWSQGVEMALDVNIIDRRDLRVNINSQWQYVENQVTSLGNLGNEGDQLTNNVGFNTRFREGLPFPAFFGFPVINPDAQEAPIRSDTLSFMGITIPPHELSIGASVTIQNRLTLEVFGTGQFGHKLLDEGAEELATVGVFPQCVGVDDIIDAWLDGGSLGTLTAMDIARCSARGSLNGVSLDDQNEDWLFDAGYFRISTASLTYRIPENLLPSALSAGTVQFRANNLHIFTNYPTGTDPDALLGAATFELFRSGGYTLPLPRSYTLNVRLNF